MNTEILKLLENDARLTPEQIAVMLNCDCQDVRKIIDQSEKNGTILGYNTIVDWEKTDHESVTAMIEVKLTPQRDRGFDRVAEKIYNYPEVKSLLLMSGGFDLAVIVHGKTMLDIGNFVARRLSPIEGVTSTATHFIMHKYKDNGIVYDRQVKDERSNCN